MLFSSYIFLFVFLPVVFIGYFALHRAGRPRLAMSFLMACSIWFYAYWNLIHLLRLILLSLAFNYCLGWYFSAHPATSQQWRRVLLVCGIAVNLAALAYFKYTDFAIGNLNALFGTELPLLHIALPLGVSFFTFTEIAYLVDSYAGRTSEYSFVNYALFVTFFPHLIAGPIVRHRQLISQFVAPGIGRMDYGNIARGLFMLSIGLFKKVCIADSFAPWVTSAFDHPSALSFGAAWAASLSYSLQLYFDFSGYSDMAIGLALLFNIVLPFNFNSPYKALTIQDFWQRWHMTLSQWLRDYLYIPIGGSRRGFRRNCLNLGVVFLLGGIWHGAAWTFIIWGLLHGTAMIVLLCWRRTGLALPPVPAWFVTFMFVNTTWVFFRANSVEDALQVLGAMSGFGGGDPGVRALTSALNVSTPVLPITAITAGLVVVVVARSSIEWLTAFRATPAALVATYALFIASVCLMSNYTEFIYFNF